MKFQQIIGADLSKNSIDCVCHLLNNHVCIENSSTGFKSLLKWFKQQKINPVETMIVMEHTGLYSYCFEEFLHKHHITFTKINGLVIKRFNGITRGKTDKVDARRIADYGYNKQDQLIAQPKSDKSMQRLKMLHSVRAHLVKEKAGLICSTKEYRNIGIGDKDLIVKSQLDIIKALTKQIIAIDNETKLLINSHEDLKLNYSLLTGMKGIGKVLATNTIIKTDNFKRFSNGRKFACYCGTAPFEHTSGSSIKGRTRVSHMADKEMKTLLDLSAKCAIRFDKELKEYFQKRVAAGKSKMSTINVVRNKIIYRMFSVIKRQTPFVEDYLHVA